MKSYADVHRCAKEPSFQVGRHVRVKIKATSKAAPSFSKPLKILKKCGKHSYLLADKRVWNASKLVLVPEGALAGHHRQAPETMRPWWTQPQPCCSSQPPSFTQDPTAGPAPVQQFPADQYKIPAASAGPEQVAPLPPRRSTRKKNPPERLGILPR